MDPTLYALLAAGLGTAGGVSAGQGTANANAISGLGDTSGGQPYHTSMYSSINPQAYAASGAAQMAAIQNAMGTLQSAQTQAPNLASTISPYLSQLAGLSPQFVQQQAGINQANNQALNNNVSNAINFYNSGNNSISSLMGQANQGTNNLYGQAASAYQPYQAQANNLVNSYANTPTLYNQGQVGNSLQNAYSTAYNNFNNLMGNNTVPTSQGINQAYGQTTQNLNPSIQTGTGAASALGGLNNPYTSGMTANALTANNPLVQNPANINASYQGALNNLNPAINTGNNSSNMLNNLTGANGAQAQQTSTQGMLNSPLIQNQIQFGTNLVNNDAATKGLTGSGQMMQNLQAYGQNLASNFIQNQEGQLSNQVNSGLNATNQYLSGTGANYGAQATAGQNIYNNLLNQSNMGNTATGAALGAIGSNVNSQNSANQSALGQTNALTGLNVGQNTNQFNQLSTMTAQQQAAYNAQQQAQLSANAQQGTAAQGLAGVYSGQAGALNTNLTNQMNSTLTNNQNYVQNGMQAQQNALQNQLNLFNTGGNLQLNTAQGALNGANTMANAMQQAYQNSYSNASNIGNLYLAQGSALSQALLGQGQQMNIASTNGGIGGSGGNGGPPVQPNNYVQNYNAGATTLGNGGTY